jgi:hypothetical protein
VGQDKEIPDETIWELNGCKEPAVIPKNWYAGILVAEFL